MNHSILILFFHKNVCLENSLSHTSSYRLISMRSSVFPFSWWSLWYNHASFDDGLCCIFAYGNNNLIKTVVYETSTQLATNLNSAVDLYGILSRLKSAIARDLLELNEYIFEWFCEFVLWDKVLPILHTRFRFYYTIKQWSLLARKNYFIATVQWRLLRYNAFIRRSYSLQKNKMIERKNAKQRNVT